MQFSAICSSTFTNNTSSCTWLLLKAFSLVILLYLEKIKIECLVSETLIMIMTTTVMFISRFLKTTKKQITISLSGVVMKYMYPWAVPDPHRKIRGGGGGAGEGGPGHTDPLIRGGAVSKKNFFRAFGLQFGLKIRGGGWASRAPPLVPPLSLRNIILFSLASTEGIWEGLYLIKCMQLATRGEILQCKRNPLEHAQ